MQIGFKILIIEDDESIGEILEGFLGAHHFKTSWAMNGEDGLRMAQEIHPSAILLDRNMPGMDGHDVLRELKLNPATAKIPVIMLTAENRRNEVEESLKLGAIDYIVKPFKPEEMVDRVKSILLKAARKKT